MALDEEKPGPDKEKPGHKSRLPAGWTNNALVSALVSAIVAGLISWTIAVDQAHGAQQGTQISQLETDARTFYKAAKDEYASRACINNPNTQQHCAYKALSPDAFQDEEETFMDESGNVKDQQAFLLAFHMANYIDEALVEAGSFDGDKARNTFESTYSYLQARCEQIIRNQQ